MTCDDHARLTEQLDARLSAIHELVYEHVATGEARLAFGHEIARARAALRVEGEETEDE